MAGTWPDGQSPLNEKARIRHCAQDELHLPAQQICPRMRGSAPGFDRAGALVLHRHRAVGQVALSGPS